jgi:hypothetical protein
MRMQQCISDGCKLVGMRVNCILLIAVQRCAYIVRDLELGWKNYDTTV